MGCTILALHFLKPLAGNSVTFFSKTVKKKNNQPFECPPQWTHRYLSFLCCRGFLEDDFRKVVAFVDEAVKIAHDVQAKTTKLKEFQVSLFISFIIAGRWTTASQNMPIGQFPFKPVLNPSGLHGIEVAGCNYSIGWMRNSIFKISRNTKF